MGRRNKKEYDKHKIVVSYAMDFYNISRIIEVYSREMIGGRETMSYSCNVLAFSLIIINNLL